MVKKEEKTRKGSLVFSKKNGVIAFVILKSNPPHSGLESLVYFTKQQKIENRDMGEDFGRKHDAKSYHNGEKK